MYDERYIEMTDQSLHILAMYDLKGGKHAVNDSLNPLGPSGILHTWTNARRMHRQQQQGRPDVNGES